MAPSHLPDKLVRGLALARGSAADVQRIIESFDGFVPAMTVLFPLAVLVAAISGTVRSNRLRSVSPLQDPLIDALLVFAVMFTAFLVFYPQPEIPDRVKLDVGDDLYTAMSAGTGNSEPWVQLAGNLVLLLPVAVLIPLRVRWFDNLGKIAIGGLLTALTVETIQFLAIPGRVASTDDVVLNTLGATMGGLLVCTPWWSAAAPPPAPSHRPVEPDDTQTVWRIIEKIEHERRPTRSRPGGRTRTEVIGRVPHAAPVRAAAPAVRTSAHSEAEPVAAQPVGARPAAGRPAAEQPVGARSAGSQPAGSQPGGPGTGPQPVRRPTGPQPAVPGGPESDPGRMRPAHSALTARTVELELPVRTPGARTPTRTPAGAVRPADEQRPGGPHSGPVPAVQSARGAVREREPARR